MRQDRENASVPQSSRLLLGVIVAVAVAAVVSLPAAARSNDFRDEFTSFDAGRWVVSSRSFGHGTLDPANVAVGDGQLGIKLPGGTRNGGEMRSTSLYRFGTYRTRMKVANAPSSLTAFFLYMAPDYQREIDIELYNDSSGRVMFSTYAGGTQTHTNTVELPFDATAAFHEYAIDFRPGSVRFLVDGSVVQTWSNGITKSAMYLFVNSWFPSWLAGQAPTTDRYTYVDWIEFAAR
jgi:beta-glucanase (GH16 family)